MRFGFQKPVGSHADVKELEYISALHQTCTPLRRDGSIDANDIIWMLLSRFGLEVQDAEVVKGDILTDLAGDPVENPRHLLDLRQMVALLLIPHLRKCEEEEKEADTNNHRHIAAIAEEIRADFSGGGFDESESESGDNKLFVTRDFVRDLLALHGELEVSDDLLDQMVEVAGGEGTEFNARSLMKALTQDLAGYDISWENKWSTTYADILGATPPIPMGRPGSLLRKSTSVVSRQSISTLRQSQLTKESNYSAGKDPLADPVENPRPRGTARANSNNDTNYTFTDSDELKEPELQEKMAEKVQRVLCLSAIDNTADTYGSQVFSVSLWLAFIAVFIAYVYANDTGGVNSNCEDKDSTFGCQVGTAIANWFGIFAQLIVLGGTFFFFSSMGNSVFLPRGLLSVCFLLVGMVTVVTFTMIPNFVTWENWFFNTNFMTSNELFDTFRAIAMFFGALLIVLQLLALIRSLMSPETVQQNEALRRWFAQGAGKKESNTKRAAAFKVNRMVDNAFNLREDEECNPDGDDDENDNLSSHISNNKNKRSPCRTVSTASKLPNTRGHSGQAMSKFLSTSYQTEASPGILWAWKTFWNSSICYEEGVWFHTRLLASAFAQIFVLLVSVSLMIAIMWQVVTTYELEDGTGTVCFMGGCAYYYTSNETETDAYLANQTEMLKGLVATSLVQSVGVEVNLTEEAQNKFYQDLELLVYEQSGVNITEAHSLVEDPFGAAEQWMIENAEQWEVEFGLAIGTAFSLLSTLWILFGYIPSFVFNVLQFRYGIVPSLYSTDFQVYRYAPDHATLVFGMAFWAQLYTAFLAFAIPGLVAFLLVWNKTATFVQGILAQLIGIVVTLLLKVVIMVVLRNLLVVGFYRKKVATTNVVFLLLECWNIALSAGFIFARMAIFLVLAIFYVGRIDTPFVNEGVDKFDFAPNLSLDRAPVLYRKDLLLHEAHRHPYLDRLAALYLLKLNLGDSFATRAGSCWRLIYVLTLMPWLSKYRVNGGAIEDGDETEELQDGPLPEMAPVKKTRRESLLEDEVTRLRAQLKVAMGNGEGKQHETENSPAQSQKNDGSPRDYRKYLQSQPDSHSIPSDTSNKQDGFNDKPDVNQTQAKAKRVGTPKKKRAQQGDADPALDSTVEV